MGKSKSTSPRRSATKPETKVEGAATVIPSFTAEQAAKVNQLIERKAHLEYLALVMLRHINQVLPLEQLVKYGVRQQIVDEDTLCELFGDPKIMEEAGVSSVEGFNLQGLLDEWQKTTDAFMSAAAGK